MMIIIYSYCIEYYRHIIVLLEIKLNFEKKLLQNELHLGQMCGIHIKLHG